MKKFYISADIEGIAGVVNHDQSSMDRRDYPQARKWMTDEVVAACEASHDFGIEKVIVADSHAGGDNILIDDLPDYVEIIRSWPRELLMVQGVECGPFEGAAFIGYHAGSRAASGVLAHTICGDIVEIMLNGKIMSETTINAAVAGHYGVQLIMASGDDVYTDHVQEAIGDVETATVKWAHGGFSARNLTPKASCALIREKITAALQRSSTFKPFRIEGPVEIEIQTASRYKAEVLSYVPTVERITSHRIRLNVADVVGVSRFINLYTRISATP